MEARQKQGGSEVEDFGVRHRDTREEAVGMETDPGKGSGSGEGLKRASATRFSMPGTCTTELVNSAKFGRPGWRNPEQSKC